MIFSSRKVKIEFLVYREAIVQAQEIALMRDDVEISLVTSKRGLVVIVSREY